MSNWIELQDSMRVDNRKKSISLNTGDYTMNIIKRVFQNIIRQDEYFGFLETIVDEENVNMDLIKFKMKDVGSIYEVQIGSGMLPRLIKINK